MPLAEQLQDPRLAALGPVQLSMVRERLWANYLSEDPNRAAQLSSLSDEGKQTAKERFYEGVKTFRPDLFQVELSPEIPAEKTYEPYGGVRATRSGTGIPAVHRPLYDPKTEAIIDGFRTGKIDPARFDDQAIEQLAPFMRANLTENDFNNFISPYRERMLKDGITAATYTPNSFIRGMAPSFIEKGAEALAGKIEGLVGDPEAFQQEQNRIRKWATAYGDIDQSLRTAGAVGGLVASGMGVGSLVERAVSRGGPRLAAHLLSAGAIDYAYADKLPGFSAELVEDPTLKHWLTAAEGLAFAGLGAVLGGATRSRPRAPERVPTPLRGIDPSEAQTALEGVTAPRHTPPGPAGGFRTTVGELAVPISTRLENIAPELKTQLRRHEFNLHTRAQEYRAAVNPWLEGKKEARMSKADNAALDLAEKNRDVETINRIVGKYHLKDQYAAKRAALGKMFKEAKTVGFDVNYLDDFAPRKVKDYQKFMREVVGDESGWGEFSRLKKAEEQRLGVDVLDMEAQASLADKWIRGFGDRIMGAQPGALKTRKIAHVTKDLNKYYKHSDEALLDYIDTIVNSTEKKRFFGADLKPSGLLEGESVNAAVHDSIGQWVANLVGQGRIAPWHEGEVAKILQARMIQKPGKDWIKTWKNVNYLDTMGTPTSAVTQLGDMAWSAYQNGYYQTAKTALGRKPIKLKDIGIDKIAAEFGTRTKLARVVDKVFDAVGLTGIDRWGKETLVNASLADWRKRITPPKAAKGTPGYRAWKRNFDKFGRELGQTFGAEAPQVLDDLANGRITENVKFLAFNRLADFQPIALSEVPETYLRNPNGRIFYQLKTFTIKQLDVFRREAFREIARGNVKEGMGNLTRLGMAFFLANATADTIKDVMMNRQPDIPDLVVDNLLRMVAMNRYAVYDMRRNKDPAKTLMMQFLPPTRWIRASSQDVSDAVNGRFDLQDANILQTIPIAGKPYHWWLGGGAENQSERGSQIVDTR